MTTENTNYSLVQEPLAWLTYSLEGYSDFLVNTLIKSVIVIMIIIIIIHYPYLIPLSGFYSSAVFYFICKKIYNLPEDITSEQWNKPKQIMASILDIVGKVLHGHEVYGIDNIPKGPAILVYYHGVIPIGYYLSTWRIYRVTGRLCYSVAHFLLFHMPGLHMFYRIHHLGNPTREKCVELLKKGHIVGVAPGGEKEFFFGNNNYKLLWNNRKGFSQVALDAKVPIIPMFTQNIQEAYRTYGMTGPLRWVYDRKWIVIPPAYGIFPVKLRTYIGQPIPYDPNLTAEELAEKTKIAVEALRDKHQNIPGSILRALGERFEMHKRDK